MADINKLVGSESRLEVGQKINEVIDYKASADLTNTGMLSNCITEVPTNRIKYTLVDGVLTIKKDTRFFVAHGTSSPTFQVSDKFYSDNLKVVGHQWKNNILVYEIETLVDLVASDIGTDNWAGLVFIDVQRGIVIPGQHSESGTTPTITSGRFYNTETNFVTDIETGNIMSFPLMAVTSNTAYFTSVLDVYDVRGHIGNTLFVNRNIKGLIADGRNDDGTLKSTEMTTYFIIDNSLVGTVSTKTLRMAINSDKMIVSDVYLQSTAQPTGNAYLWYNPDTNIMMRSGATTGVFTRFNMIPFVEVGLTDGVMTYLSKPEVLRLDDKVSKNGDTMFNTLNVRMNGDCIRFNNGYQSVIQRLDSTALYFLLTDEGDPDGTWNSLRPLKINLNDGAIQTTTPGLADNSTRVPTTAWCDGQWVKKSVSIASNVSLSAGEAVKSYSLSTHLPSDSRVYDVIISINATSSGSKLELSAYGTNTNIWSRILRTTGTGGGSVRVLIGSDRKLNIKCIVPSGTGTIESIYLEGYRRVR